MTCRYPHCGCMQQGGPGPCEPHVTITPTPFSPERERHSKPLFTNDCWRTLNCRADMRDFGNPGEWVGAADYCLDRYSRIEFTGAPGYRGE